jgi:hypothetical protein
VKKSLPESVRLSELAVGASILAALVAVRSSATSIHVLKGFALC